MRAYLSSENFIGDLIFSYLSALQNWLHWNYHSQNCILGMKAWTRKVWDSIRRKHNCRWQHLSRMKNVFFWKTKNLSGEKHSRLVSETCGTICRWWSPIGVKGAVAEWSKALLVRENKWKTKRSQARAGAIFKIYWSINIDASINSSLSHFQMLG